jgi:hypothetical protein
MKSNLGISNNLWSQGILSHIRYKLFENALGRKM